MGASENEIWKFYTTGHFLDVALFWSRKVNKWFTLLLLTKLADYFWDYKGDAEVGITDRWSIGAR